MSKFSAFTMIAFGFSALVSPIAAQAASEVRLTLHNDYGQTVRFSCNGGSWRELHRDENRTVIVHLEGEEVHCSATHDGRQVWSGRMDVHGHNPVTMTIRHVEDSHN